MKRCLLEAPEKGLLLPRREGHLLFGEVVYKQSTIHVTDRFVDLFRLGRSWHNRRGIPRHAFFIVSNPRPG